MHRIKKNNIRFRLNFILDIGDFHHAVLTTTKNFYTKTFLSEPDLDSTEKMQFPTSFGFLKKDFLSELF